VGFGLGVLVTGWNTPTPPAADARLAELEARLVQRPDTPTRLALAHLYLDGGRVGEAIPLYREVLRQEPENVDALMHMGTILLRAGHGEEALRYLDRALAKDPENAHALWDKGQVQATLLGDDAGALETWERFLRVAPGPEDAARAREMIAEVRSRMQARPVAGASPGTPPPGRGGPKPDDATVRAARDLLARIGAAPPTEGAPTSPGAGKVPAQRAAAAPHPGEQLFWERGCAGCHAIRGVGGKTGPDLAGLAREKGRDVAWHVRFLKEPATVLPGIPMPSYRHLPEQELRTLAEFLVSL
jgi:tetratricopeptide (TPR) repeat protein